MSKYTRKRIYKKKPAKVSKTVKKAVNTIVKRQINKFVESKNLYINSTTDAQTTSKTPASATYTYGLTTVLVQGDAEGQRTSDEINMMTLNIKLRAVASSSTPDVFRIVIILWKPSTSTANLPAFDDIFVEATNQDYLSCMSPISDKNKQLFKVLVDRFITLNTYSPVRAYNMKLNFKGLKQQYTGATDAATTYHTNRVIMYLIGEGSPTNPFCVYSHFTYKDG